MPVKKYNLGYKNISIGIVKLDERVCADLLGASLSHCMNEFFLLTSFLSSFIFFFFFSVFLFFFSFFPFL